MDNLYDLLKFFHVIGFVFMSIPLFNLIVVNERALLGISYDYYADRYMENIISLSLLCFPINCIAHRSVTVDIRSTWD